MQTPTSTKTNAFAVALLGAVSLFTVTSAQAAFIAAPYGGVTTPTPLPLDGPLGGDVVAFSENAFLDTAFTPNFTGFLRSIVVDPDGAGPGTALDFYYQIQNDSPGSPVLPLTTGDYEIFSFAVQYGFGIANNVSAVSLSSLGALGGLTLPGSFSTAPTVGKTVYQAYRDIPLSDGAGFTFDASNTAPDPSAPFNNIGVGLVSNWLVFRTTTSTFETVPTGISYGLGGVEPNSFAPVPEPSTALLGLVGFAVCAGRRFRKSSAGPKS